MQGTSKTPQLLFLSISSQSPWTMALPLVFTTPCGHEATVKLCQSKKGPNAGKWVVKIKGRKVTLASGVKTKYCAPNQDAAKQAIASFLGINSSTIFENNSAAAAVNEQAPKAKMPQTAPVGAPTPTITTTPTVPPLAQQQPPMTMVADFRSGLPYALPPIMANQFPFPNMGICPPVFGMPPDPAPLTTVNVPPAGSNVMAPNAPTLKPSPIPSASIMSNGNVPAIFNQAGAVAAVSAGSSVMVPTAEQERIYQHVKPPSPLDTNFTVRITAGAGAGKTTTVLQVASNAARLGHSHITYVTFAKVAAADGARRIQEALSDLPNPPTVEARTLHSCAMKLLSNERKEVFEEESSRLINDDALQDFIKTVCEREIQDFLAHAKEEIASRNKKDLSKAASMLHAAERQVLFYVFKTFTQFCRSPYTVEQFKDPFFKCRDYFPAQKYHQGGGEGEKQGFPPTIYSSKFGRYADMACLVWDAATQQGIRSYDMEMKRAQVKGLRIPGTVLLVDESQDMDGCQVNWITSQRNHGTHIYIVGDAAQTIYSFRGAKSKYMVDIQGAVDFSLTKSWRFGPEIASVANVILYAKQKSKQSARETSSWKPYRVKGGGGKGMVTSDPILPNWHDMPVTVIASTNATLLHMAVSMLGMKVGTDANEDFCDENVEMEICDRDVVRSKSSVDLHVGASNTLPERIQDEVPIVSDDALSPIVKLENSPDPVKSSVAENVASRTSEGPFPIAFPKIHINGNGENSGFKKWQSVLKQIQHIYDLYKSGDDGYILPSQTFYEFKGERLTWSIFRSQVETRELNRYMATIQVVNAFGDKTMEVIALFKNEVMDKKYSEDEADVILSTTHAAKGMEWDNVQVCNDFVDLFKVSCDGPQVTRRGSPSKRTSWQSHIKQWGDDANLLYVACTRAKKLLSIPSSIQMFLQDCDVLHDMIRYRKLFREHDVTKSSDIAVFGREHPLSVQDVLDVYQDVVVPLRMENNLQTKQHLMSALVKPLDGQAEYDDDKSVDGDDDFEHFFGYQTPTPVVSTPNTVSAAALNTLNTASTATKSAVNTQVSSRSPGKKQKMSEAYYVLEEAKKSAALAPRGKMRPYDKKEKSFNASARCRECKEVISLNANRVGVQVYMPEQGEFWCRYFHEKCFPKEYLPQLRLDPNSNRKKAGKISWERKEWWIQKSYSSYGKGWKRGGYKKY